MVGYRLGVAVFPFQDDVYLRRMDLPAQGAGDEAGKGEEKTEKALHVVVFGATIVVDL